MKKNLLTVGALSFMLLVISFISYREVLTVTFEEEWTKEIREKCDSGFDPSDFKSSGMSSFKAFALPIGAYLGLCASCVWTPKIIAGRVDPSEKWYFFFIRIVIAICLFYPSKKFGDLFGKIDSGSELVDTLLVMIPLTFSTFALFFLVDLICRKFGLLHMINEESASTDIPPGSQIEIETSERDNDGEEITVETGGFE